MFSWNKYPLLRILIPFVAGIIIVFHIDFAFHVWVLLFITAVGVLSMSVLQKYQTYRNRWLCGLLIIISIFSFSVAYTQFFIDAGKPSQSLIENNDKLLFIASVVDPPTIKKKSVKITVKMEAYKQDETFQNDRSKIIIHVAKDERSEKIAYGDKLLFYTYLNKVAEPKNPKEFNYKRYLSIKNIYLQAYVDARSWQKISEKHGNPIIRFASNTRNKFLKIFRESNMDVQEYGIISAILLSSNADLDPDLQRSYSAAGVSHILSVSGMHIGIVYIILAFFLSFMDKTKNQRIARSFILLVVIWGYACITGLATSVIRCGTMLSFVAVGGVLNRKTNSYNSLMTSMIFLLLLNPLVILQLGFQLSYLAVFGILWTQRRFSLLYETKTKTGKHIWDIITVSLAAQLFTAPLAIFYFHQFPNYFLLTNIALITLLPLVIGVGMAVLVFSFWSFTYQYISLVLTYLIKSMNWIVLKTETLPYSLTPNIDISIWQVILAYLLIMIAMSAFFYKKKVYVFQVLALAIVFLGIDLHKQIKVNRQKEIVFYSLKSGYAIDCIDGRNSTLICDSNTLNDKQIYDYSIKNNHVYHQIKETKSKLGLHFIKFYDKTILIIDKPIYSIDCDKKLKVNYILLSNNLPISVETLQKMFDFDMIIADGTYSYYRLNYIRNVCAEKIIPFHELKNQGASVVKL
jgi:competence protein ComEC